MGHRDMWLALCGRCLVVGIVVENAYTTFKRHGIMIIEIELKLKTLTFVVFDPVASFRPLSCLGFFLIFHFLARHCGSKPQPMSASLPIENLNFKGM